ncbi:hypothetical protein LEN26_002720 [Aphanomyces euteiches]|nr:hypothetical protein AeMF1_000761 [Aphanomyces euteiches]KAH9158786.1 hypothetical protein LEN26_002720 [Aphanomyces euteiches]KAH9186301.1 hypothetical protein AeNC1_011728 [Aphanomyces euteiches]
MLKCASVRSPRPSGNQDVFQLPPGPKTQLWEKEFSVLFDERKPIGLGFIPVKDATYACSVDNVVSNKIRDNHAFDHNEHCYMSCDTSRAIVPGLRIRAINDLDVEQLSFDAVVAKIKTAKRPVLLTFADVSSLCLATTPKIALPEAPTTESLAAEVVRLRELLQEATLAKEDAERQLENFKKWNQSLLTTNDEMGDQQLHVMEQIRQDRQALEGKQAQITQLQTERDHAQQALASALIENRGIQERLEHLHSRLEETQAAKRAVDDKLAALERKRGDELYLVDKLHREILVEDNKTNELDKLLHAADDKPDVNQQDKHEETMAKLRMQRADHAAQKAALEAALANANAQAQADRQLIEQLQVEKERLQNAAQPSIEPSSSSASLTTTTAPSKEELDALRTRFDTAKLKWNAQKEQWKAEKAALQARVHALEHHGHELERSLTTSQLATSEQQQNALEKEQLDEMILRDFVQRMSTKGWRIHKHGRRGDSHERYLYMDPAGHWLSWTSVEDARHEDAFRHPNKKIVVDVKDIVDVLVGKETQILSKKAAAPPTRCFSLVCAKPCRTIDIQADTPEQCQRLVQGFRLLHAKLSKRALSSSSSSAINVD